jgi:hypothetical protein
MSAVTAALVASVTWRASPPDPAPPESTHATQVSTVPKQSSPAAALVRSASTASRMAINLVADALGARRMPSACSARQVPTVRRSCHPIPGASGFPVARSQTMLEALWLAMPTAATGPPSRERRVRHGEDGVGHQSGVELHQPRCRGVGEDRA